MEDLASFIQSMSEKYGLLETAGNKIGSTTSHRLIRTADTHQGIEQEGDLGLDTNWECLSTFLNSNTDEVDRQPVKHEVRKKSQTSKRIKLARKLLQEQSSQEEEGDDDDDGEGESASSARTSMKTSDLLHNASFLDELQNPSLSDDLRSTGMTHGRTSSDSVDKENDHCSGQSSLLVQEFLTNAGEEDLDEVEFAQEMGIQPQKESDARSWQTSQLWFQEYTSAKQSAAAKNSFSERPLDGEAPKDHGPADHHFKDQGYSLAHDILLSSGSSTSPGTDLDSQVAEDCHSAAASDCGAPAATAVACGSRCEIPDDFAAAVGSVEREREKAVLVNARVERMLEESGASHRGPVVCRSTAHVSEENGGGTSSSGRIGHEEFFADVRVKDLSNGSVGSVARQSSSSRVADIDEASKLLLVQLDKSRSLLGPSTPKSFMRRSPSLQQATRHRQPGAEQDPDICHSGGGLDEVQGCRSEEDHGVSPRSQRKRMSPISIDSATAPSKGQQEYESKSNGHSSILRCHEEEHDSRNRSPTCQQDDFVARASPRDLLQADPNSSGRHQQHHHHQPGRANFPRSDDHYDAASSSPRHPEYEGKRVSPGQQVEEYHDVWRYSSGYEQDDHSRASPSHQDERVDHGGKKYFSRKHLNLVREDPEVEVNNGYEVKRPSSRNQLQEIDRRRISSRDSQAKHSPEPQHVAPADHVRSPSSEDQDDSPGSHAQSYGRGRRALSRDNQSNGIHERRDFEAGNDAIGHPRNCHKDEKFCTTRSDESANYYQDDAKPWEKAWNELEKERGIEEEELRRPVEANNPVECHTKWERINDLLCQNGFPPVRSPSSTFEFEKEIYLVLSDIVTNYERREKLVQALLEESEDLRQGEERLHSHMQQLESERDEMKQNLAACEQRAEVASETAERNYAALRRECQKLESSNANLMQRCRNSQLEHACRAKERTLQKLQDKVRVSMEKEERHRTNDKEAYEKLKHKVAAAQRTNGEALEPNFLQRDLKPAQIVGVYERQKVILENEIATLRAENGQLCRDLCEKENLILNKVLGTEETKKAFEMLSRKQQSQQLEEKEKEIRRLQEELKTRPTVEVLEERFHVASCQLKEPHQHLRNDHRQNIGSLERILQQICQLLELDEPGSILETLESLLLLVSAVPRMEQFVGNVCNIIFIEGQNWILSSNGGDEVSRTPDAVPGILQTWLPKLEASSELHSFKESIMRMLWERDENGAHSAPEMSNQAALECVKNLIDVENDYLLSKASYRDADAIVKAEPEKLLHRVLGHFQMLFEVPQLEGVMAVMNSVYIQCSEYHNFARALCSMLGLEKEAGPNTIISAVNSILSSRMM